MISYHDESEGVCYLDFHTQAAASGTKSYGTVYMSRAEALQLAGEILKTSSERDKQPKSVASVATPDKLYKSVSDEICSFGHEHQVTRCTLCGITYRPDVDNIRFSILPWQFGSGGNSDLVYLCFGCIDRVNKLVFGVVTHHADSLD